MPDDNITTNVSRIRSAVYGREVREAIARSIEQCYTDTSMTATLAGQAASDADAAASRANTAAAEAEVATGTANSAASAAASAAENLTDIAYLAVEASTASVEDTVEYVINGQTGGE